MPHRPLPRVVYLFAAASAALAFSASQATGAVSEEPGPIFAPPKVFVTQWWQCPETGACKAPTLRLWLPSFGRGYAKVESGRVTGTCGWGCFEIPNGEEIVIRAVADPGHRFTGWGGKCESIGRTTGCRFNMWNNYTAGSTFEPIPSASPGTPGKSQDPVTPVLDFVIQISGKGTVVVQGAGAYPTSVCKTAYPCRVTRYVKKDVQLLAIATGGRFLGWGGRCRGTELSCTFKNDFGRDGAPRVTAYFG